MPPIRLEGEVSLQSDICTAWSLVADTERQNRLLRLAPLQVLPVGDAASSGAVRFTVRTLLGGFNVEWEELPTEFVRFEWFRVRRRITKGPLRHLEVEVRLAAEGAGTRLRVALTVEPTHALLRPLARHNLARSLKAMLALAVELERTAGANTTVGGSPRMVSTEALERASGALRAALPPELTELGERLTAYVRDAPDHVLIRLRPFELADAWEVPREAMLHVCLTAAVEGLLESTWEAVCPSCRGPSAKVGSLAEVTGHGDCRLCDLQFELTLDESLEMTFAPAAAVRKVESGPFCISGPSRLPHVVSQSILPADAPVELRGPAESGRYRLFIRGGETLLLRVEEDADARVVFAPGERTLRVKPGGTVEVAPRGTQTHVKLEHLEWASKAVTAHQLALTPVFRRLFSHEALRPGVALAVKRVALLFSDLTGSTALYSRLGDAAAFRLVHEHFELLSTIVEAHGGAVVKTIGDAVMAAFPDERQLVKAALRMQQAFFDFARDGGILSPLSLKLGAYSGPCYAVGANSAMDYFGQSVNIAARLQGASEPGELVLPAELAERARAAGLFDQVQVSERFRTLLRGLDVQLWAVRVRLPTERAARI